MAPPKVTFPDGQLPEPQGAFAEILPELWRAVAEEGYTTPTPIQAQSIPWILRGRDLMGIAQTGTGKTAAFTLPILQYLTENPRRPQPGVPRVLILAPTRELAAQIGESIACYGRHVRASHTVIFGGVGQNPQVNALRRGLDVVVATPGRLLDLMQQGHLRIDEIEVFVLDEVDRMLDMGFIHDIRRIIAKLPEKRQTLFFSATLPTKVLSLAHKMVHDPVEVSVAPEQPTVERIEQKVLFVEKNDKDALLTDLLRDRDLDKVIVFTRMKHVANKVVKRLSKEGIAGSAIHGNKSQNARIQALDGFKSGRIRVLVATDVAARGLDIDGVSHVINYDLPDVAETYVHRIGRTARAGAEGDAISFCSSEERDALRDIERFIRQSVPVDPDHPFHSDAARRATGSAARPASKVQRGGGGGGRGARAGRASPARPWEGGSHGSDAPGRGRRRRARPHDRGH